MNLSTLETQLSGRAALDPKLGNNLINGAWVPSASGQTFANENPSETTDVIGFLPGERQCHRREMTVPRTCRLWPCPVSGQGQSHWQGMKNFSRDGRGRTR